MAYMDAAAVLAVIDRLAAGKPPMRDIHGLVRTINNDDLHEALADAPDWPLEAIEALEGAGTIRVWGGGYVLYIDRVYEAPLTAAR